MNPTVFLLMRNQEISVWVVSPSPLVFLSTLPLSFHHCRPRSPPHLPTLIATYLGHLSVCFNHCWVERETPLGDEAHFSPVKVGNLIISSTSSASPIVVLLILLHPPRCCIHKMLLTQSFLLPLNNFSNFELFLGLQRSRFCFDLLLCVCETNLCLCSFPTWVKVVVWHQ